MLNKLGFARAMNAKGTGAVFQNDDAAVLDFDKIGGSYSRLIRLLTPGQFPFTRHLLMSFTTVSTQRPDLI